MEQQQSKLNALRQFLVCTVQLVCVVAWLWAVGELIRRHFNTAVGLWISFPTAACLLLSRRIASCFTLTGLRVLQGLLMGNAMLFSFAMFSQCEHPFDIQGKGISGLTRSGELLFLAAVILFPVITWHASKRFIHNAEYPPRS